MLYGAGFQEDLRAWTYRILQKYSVVKTYTQLNKCGYGQVLQG